MRGRLHRRDVLFSGISILCNTPLVLSPSHFLGCANFSPISLAILSLPFPYCFNGISMHLRMLSIVRPCVLHTRGFCIYKPWSCFPRVLAWPTPFRAAH
ncbi:hypothetical protein B0H10DRAFT_773788 [Mycena sp. CBHHK59/15]|nr:hypothetical protein B0H10DRAFT_773788 [Mycena sp. CBHHK59/15]